MTPQKSILGIFPSLGYFDGIGRSGLSAWKGICGAPFAGHVLITYGKTPPPAELPGRVLHARTQAGTMLNAVRSGISPRTTLFWHVHLLRLLSFLRTTGKVVVYLHGIEAWRRLSSPLRKHLAGVDLVLTNSDYTWSRFLEFNPEFASLPHATVPLGLDEPVHTPTPPPSGPPAALMIGRISKTEAYKGHDAVLSVWSEVRRRIPGAELHVIGPGDFYDDLQALAVRHGVADACHLHGAVSQGRKEALILQARCMALPSRGEGFGLAYIEAMRLGRPCLVSHSDAGREVVNPPEAGLAADPNDRAALTDALCALLSPGPQWDQWSAASRARYGRLYTEAAFTARLNEQVGLS